MIVKPETLIGWHRKGFKLFWKWKSRMGRPHAYCEPLVGTVRRECLDFMIPFGAAHLRRILKEWVRHYNQGRPHLSLGPGIPEPAMLEVHPCPRDERALSKEYRVAARGILGGPHHEYRRERIAACSEDAAR